MKLLVNGVEREITLMKFERWTYQDISQDFIQSNTILIFDEESDLYRMTEDEFEYWTEKAEIYEKILDMEEDLSEEELEEYRNEAFGYEFDTELDVRLSWLNALEVEQEKRIMQL